MPRGYWNSLSDMNAPLTTGGVMGARLPRSPISARAPMVPMVAPAADPHDAAMAAARTILPENAAPRPIPVGGVQAPPMSPADINAVAYGVGMQDRLRSIPEARRTQTIGGGVKPISISGAPAPGYATPSLNAEGMAGKASYAAVKAASDAKLAHDEQYGSLASSPAVPPPPPPAAPPPGIVLPPAVTTSTAGYVPNPLNRDQMVTPGLNLDEKNFAIMPAGSVDPETGATYTQDTKRTFSQVLGKNTSTVTSPEVLSAEKDARRWAYLAEKAGNPNLEADVNRAWSQQAYEQAQQADALKQSQHERDMDIARLELQAETPPPPTVEAAKAAQATAKTEAARQKVQKQFIAIAQGYDPKDYASVQSTRRAILALMKQTGTLEKDLPQSVQHILSQTRVQ